MSNEKGSIETIPLGLKRVGAQGKITIPSNIRKKYNIKEGDLVNVSIILPRNHIVVVEKR